MLDHVFLSVSCNGSRLKPATLAFNADFGSN